MSVLVIIGAIATALISGLVALYIAHRNTSGRIDTTEAAKLWEEAQGMRQELRDETVMLRERVTNLEKISAEHQQEATECQQRERDLREQVDECKKQIATLKRRMRNVR